MSQSYLEKLVSTNYKWKVLKRKKPPKWWLISSYKNVLQVWSGGLFADAECKICKYKSLIISTYTSNQREQILCGGTEEGRKIYKNLQMKLPSKIKYTNICKDVFPVLCIFTFVNAFFCRFLLSLKIG